MNQAFRLNRPSVRSVTVLLLALFFDRIQAKGENREGAFTLTPYFGGQISIFVDQYHLEGNYQWGVRGGYNFTPHLGAEFIYVHCETRRDPQDVGATVQQYGGDFLYFFRPDKRLVPYVVGGFGAYQVDHEERLPNRRTGYFNFGGGVDYALTKSISVRADVRDTIPFDHDGNSTIAATIGLRFQIRGH
jgi:OOP family OmpA-OmpF porin